MLCKTVNEMKQQVVVAAVVIDKFISAIVSFYNFDSEQFVYVPIVRLLRLDEQDECFTLLGRLTLAIEASASVLPSRVQELSDTQRSLLIRLHVPFTKTPTQQVSKLAAGSRSVDKGPKSRSLTRTRSTGDGSGKPRQPPQGTRGKKPPPAAQRTLQTATTALRALERDAELLQSCCRTLLPGCVVERVLAVVSSRSLTACEYFVMSLIYFYYNLDRLLCA